MNKQYTNNNHIVKKSDKPKSAFKQISSGLSKIQIDKLKKNSK